MVCKHFNVSANYVETELLLARWLVYLAISLDLEEREQYNIWVMSGQDPKKFNWASDDRAGTAPRLADPSLGRKIVAFAVEKLQATPIRGDIWTLAKARGMRPVFRIETPDGYRYVDDQGNPVQVPRGMTFIESPALKKAAGDKKIFVRES